MAAQRDRRESETPVPRDCVIQERWPHVNLIVGSDLDPTNPPELWVVPTSVHILRTSVEMASCLTALLSQCNQVLFIDPYFGPGKRKYCEPLRRFLAAIASRGKRRMPGKIEYHTSNQDKGIARFQQDLEQWIKPCLPPTVTLTVVRWNQAEMHNRYVLTDRGGVMFGHGLDQDDSRPTRYDTVSLLDEKTYSELLDDYSAHSTKLTWLSDTFSVTG
jgi:hypothetical protein